MLLGSLAFSVMGNFARALRETCTWQVTAISRSLIPFTLVGLLALATGAKLVLWRPGTLWIRSIAGSLSMVGTFYCLTQLPVSEVLTLTNMFPLWVALLSWPLFNEPPTLMVWLSLASGLSGVALMQQPHLADGNIATYIALACSLSTAVAMLGLHRLHGVDIRAIVVHFSGVAFLLCLASLFLFERTTPTVGDMDAHEVLLLLAVGGTATMGQFFLTKAFVAGPPAKVAVVALTQVAFALIIDILVWKYAFNGQSLLGMGLVVAPTAWVLSQRPTLESSGPAIPDVP